MQAVQQQIQQGVFVTGTDTDVGKTWLGQRIIRQLSDAGISVVPKKPVESGWNADQLEKTDAWKLAKAAQKGQERDLQQVCAEHFTAALSPVRAAAMEGKKVHLEELKQQCFTAVGENEFLYVEGAGGFFSPLASDALNADLAKALGLPVLLIAEDRLGCINHILLTLAAIENYGLAVLGVVLNTKLQQKKDVEMNNYADLQALISYPVFQFKYQQNTLEKKLMDLLLVAK